MRPAGLVGSLALAMHGAFAYAQAPDELPPPPQILLPDYVRNFPLDVEGAVRMPDARIISRPIFDGERSPHPVYPEDARRAYEKGEVTLGVCVSDKGAVTKSIVLRSSGYERLDAASLDWIDAVVFEPAKTEEGPVAVCGHYLTYVWRLEGPTFPPFVPLANAAALGIPRDTPLYDEALYPLLGDLEGVQAPKQTFAPPLPTYPPQHGARPGPGIVRLCIAPQGRAITVSGMDDLHPLAGSFAMLWFNALRFTPAMQDGKAIGVCGIEAELRWR